MPTLLLCSLQLFPDKKETLLQLPDFVEVIARKEQNLPGHQLIEETMGERDVCTERSREPRILGILGVNGE